MLCFCKNVKIKTRRRRRRRRRRRQRIVITKYFLLSSSPHSQAQTAINRAPAGEFVEISSQHVPLRAQHQRGAPQQGRTRQAKGFDVALPKACYVSVYTHMYIMIIIYTYTDTCYLLCYMYTLVHNVHKYLLYIHNTHVIYAYTHHLALHQIDTQEQNTVLT